jgi:hypothetical protein
VTPNFLYLFLEEHLFLLDGDLFTRKCFHDISFVNGAE